jgi:hypothetical protein
MLVSFGTDNSSREISNTPGLCSFHGKYFGFGGLTKNSSFKLWNENNVELYKPVDAPRKPKTKSGEVQGGG